MHNNLRYITRKRQTARLPELDGFSKMFAKVRFSQSPLKVTEDVLLANLVGFLKMVFFSNKLSDFRRHSAHASTELRSASYPNSGFPKMFDTSIFPEVTKNVSFANQPNFRRLQSIVDISESLDFWRRLPNVTEDVLPVELIRFPNINFFGNVRFAI